MEFTSRELGAIKLSVRGANRGTPPFGLFGHNVRLAHFLGVCPGRQAATPKASLRAKIGCV